MDDVDVSARPISPRLPLSHVFRNSGTSLSLWASRAVFFLDERSGRKFAWPYVGSKGAVNEWLAAIG